MPTSSAYLNRWHDPVGHRSRWGGWPCGSDRLRRLDLDELKVLPVDAPCDFVPTAWRTALKREGGSLERQIWEIALSLAVRDALRAGNLHLAESRKHVSFWNLVYDENQWADEREEAYTALVLPNEAERVLEKLRQEYVEAVEQVECGLPDNPFAIGERRTTA